MSTYLINHLRIPGGVPNEAGLSYLEQVEATVRPYGGKWLAQGDVNRGRGGLARLGGPDGVPGPRRCREVVRLG
ncbi:hypothetical protein ONO86_04321 [Micromonospora noduli]|nr:hypothetical protein ONO86_04321 [Micromonospora noduli]